jgi:hypothetical protein
MSRLSAMRVFAPLGSGGLAIVVNKRVRSISRSFMTEQGKGRFSPLLALVLPLSERQVAKYSSNSIRLVTDKSSALADGGPLQLRQITLSQRLMNSERPLNLSGGAPAARCDGGGWW